VAFVRVAIGATSPRAPQSSCTAASRGVVGDTGVATFRWVHPDRRFSRPLVTRAEVLVKSRLAQGMAEPITLTVRCPGGLSASSRMGTDSQLSCRREATRGRYCKEMETVMMNHGVRAAYLLSRLHP